MVLLNRHGLWLIGGLLLAGLGGWAFHAYRSSPAPIDAPPEPPPALRTWPAIPPLSESRFLNTSPEATFVGAGVCRECHEEEYRSYLQTQHSRSLCEVDLATEPPDVEFRHAPSGRSYRVYRRDGRLWHREYVRGDDGEELLLADYPMRYVFGSGTHARSYAVAVEDGYLVESPLTWYPARKVWGMSPGYDVAEHWAFERVAEFRCVLCHVGRVERVDDRPDVLRVVEPLIDCERCHGPGSLHVARRRAGGEDVRTIVHPRRLSRELNEAICAQCHLGPAAAVDVRGRSIADFRPGRPLTDFRIDYDFEVPDEAMQVVGHFAQMRQSRCYQASATLTCTTCHNPHAKPDVAVRVAYYRDKCLSCHTAPKKECRLAEQVRRAQQPQDSCFACHMPASPTSVPHTSFTHHRIGLHRPQKGGPAAAGPGRLVPLYDISALPPLDRDRCLGLAYLRAAGEAKQPEHRDAYVRRGRELLEGVRQRGLRDAEVEAGLARTYCVSNPDRAIELAENALRFEDATSSSRLDAFWVLSTVYYDRKELGRAREYTEQLVRLRREADDWMRLSECRYADGDEPGALAAAERAAAINPGHPYFQLVLSRMHARRGDFARAAEHRRRHELLSKLRQATPAGP